MTPRQGKKFLHLRPGRRFGGQAATRGRDRRACGDTLRRGAGRGRTPALPLPQRTTARRRNRYRPGCDPRPLLHRASGGGRARIAGIDETTALNVLGEIGLDMSRWATVKHFTSWLGLCLHHKISGGRVLSRRTRPTANLAAARAPGRGELASQSERLGRVFPAAEVAEGDAEGNHGDGAQASRGTSTRC